MTGGVGDMTVGQGSKAESALIVEARLRRFDPWVRLKVEK
jgi:hypothetical protein